MLKVGNFYNPRLAKNRSKRWEIRYTDQSEADGVTRTISTGETNRAAAQAIFDEWLDGERDALSRASQKTVNEILDLYVKKYAGSTHNQNKTQLFAVKPIRKALGTKPLCDVKLVDIEGYKTARGLDVKPNTIRRELGALVAAMNFCIKHKEIDAADVPVVDLPPPSAPKDLFLDESQAKVFVSEADAHSAGKKRLTRATRFAYLGLYTAARKSAIEGLTWSRVDLKNRIIDYNDPERGVTKKRRVAVPISSILLPILERAYQEKQSDYVLDPGSVRKSYSSFLKNSSFPWATAHVLRHTWATLAARRKVPMWEIAGVLGDDEATVRKHYLHHRPDHLRGAVDSFM